MLTEAQYAAWYLRQAQAHEIYSLARTYNLMGTVPAFMLAYAGATNQMLTIQKGWIIKYAFPIFCVLYIGFAQFNAIVDSIYSHSYFKIAFAYYKSQGITVVDNKPFLILSSTFQRAQLFPFMLMLMWAFIMVNTKLGTTGQIVSPLVFTYLIEMVFSTAFGMLTSPQICK